MAWLICKDEATQQRVMVNMDNVAAVTIKQVDVSNRTFWGVILQLDGRDIIFSIHESEGKAIDGFHYIEDTIVRNGGTMIK